MARITPGMVPKDYPKRIRDLRIQLALTQRQFAKRLAVSVNSVKAWELGSYRPSTPCWSRFLALEAEVALTLKAS